MAHYESIQGGLDLPRIDAHGFWKPVLLLAAAFSLGWIVAEAPPVPEAGSIEEWHGNVRVSAPK